MELEIKTVSFGGYDKKATETYILEQQRQYENEIAKLKEDATKLSEAVKGLQQMREANMTESKSTIDNLQTVNEQLQAEVEKLKNDLEGYKTREIESASRYESISRTLLSARESADALTQKTNAECEAKTQETTEQCKAMIEETTGLWEDFA
jgi:cell division septum initiation protein DivIVA